MCRLRATLPSPRAHGSHESDAALLAYLFPIQRPSPTKKTPEGQNKESYLWMCQHGPSWNPAHTLSNEPDNSTGAFSSQEKWYLQNPLAGWNQNLCSSSGDTGEKAFVNLIGITQPHLVETEPVTKRESEYQILDNDDGMRMMMLNRRQEKWRWAEAAMIISALTAQVCACVCEFVHKVDILTFRTCPSASPDLQFPQLHCN